MNPNMLFLCFVHRKLKIGEKISTDQTPRRNVKNSKKKYKFNNLKKAQQQFLKEKGKKIYNLKINNIEVIQIIKIYKKKYLYR